MISRNRFIRVSAYQLFLHDSAQFEMPHVFIYQTYPPITLYLVDDFFFDPSTSIIFISIRQFNKSF